MMLIIEGVVILLISIGLGYGLYIIGKRLLGSYMLRKNIRPAKLQNQMKEQNFLDTIIEDIRKNTDDWFAVHDGAYGGSSSIIANDAKNIGIVYGGGNDSMTIVLNLDDLEKFDNTAEDTVKLSVYGDHVNEFLRDAEDLIDKRGREIAFFNDELEKRL